MSTMFQFYTPKSRMVYFHIGNVAIHNFDTGEWVITTMIGNQQLELPASYVLTEDEDLGDPRIEEYSQHIIKLAKKIKSGIGWQTDENSHRRLGKSISDLSEPGFKNGEDFSAYIKP